MRHYEFFLDHCAAFRLQIGQLVVQEVERRQQNKKIDSCCVTCCAIKKVFVA